MCHDFLPGAGFAFDEDRGAGLRDLFDDARDLGHGCGTADETAEPFAGLGSAFAKGFVFFDENLVFLFQRD